MSSYLSIYVVPKKKSPEEDKQHIILATYSRNTEMYQHLRENVNPAHIGMDEDRHTPIGKKRNRAGIESI